MMIRRVILFLSIPIALFSFVGTSFGDTENFAVSVPSSSFTLSAGEVFRIQWGGAEVDDGTPISEWVEIDLDLYKDGVAVHTIGSVVDFGWYDWLVPEGFSGQFTIRARRALSGEVVESDVFSIRDSFLVMSEPTEEDKIWMIGSYVTVSWTGNAGSLAGIDIVLRATDGTAESVTVAYDVDPFLGSVQILLSENIRIKPYEIQIYDSLDPETSPLARTIGIIEVHKTPGPYPDGILLREENDEEVWLIKTLPSGKEFRRHVLTWDMALWYGHIGDFWGAVQTVPDGTLERYLPSAWVRLPLTDSPTTWKVYEVNADATKHWLTCAFINYCESTWRTNGGDPDGIYTVNNTEMDFYTVGPDVFYIGGIFDEGIPLIDEFD